MGFPYKKVLVAIDFSPASRRALREASRLAGSEAELELIHVTQKLKPSIPWSSVNRKIVTKLGRNAVTDARAALVELAEGLRNARVRTQVRIGVPHEAILAEAKRRKADVIVVGSRGHTLSERLAMGSTTERLVRKASVPVLVVPARR
ncbi:MAG: universal stress protein [Deltaproteobacteria bacterium]|nr:universal stress protein [Deltaproteobacteria bacterium]MBW2444803.1 universal stress protein [Deltaproteobacteria bacterium]